MSNEKSSKEIPPEVTKVTVEDIAFSLVHLQANPPKESSSAAAMKKNSDKGIEGSGKSQDFNKIPEDRTISKTQSTTKVQEMTEPNEKDPSTSHFKKTIKISGFNDTEPPQDKAFTSNLTQQYDNVLDGIMERMKVSTGERNAETTLWEQKFFC